MCRPDKNDSLSLQHTNNLRLDGFGASDLVVGIKPAEKEFIAYLEFGRIFPYARYVDPKNPIITTIGPAKADRG